MKAGIVTRPEDVGKSRYGVPLESHRNQFIERELAVAFFEFTARMHPKPTDDEIKARYQKQFSHYHTSEGTKWQRIDIDFDKYPNREQALAVAEALHKEIQSGLSFDLAASQRSDSSFAAISGLSHWMPLAEVDKLGDKKLRETLKTLPENDISSVIELENCYSIVRIVGRRQESTVPLESRSASLAQEIWDEQNAEAQYALINELFIKADIHTILDRDWDTYCAKKLLGMKQIVTPQPKPILRPLLRKDLNTISTLDANHVVAMVNGDPIYAMEISSNENLSYAIQEAASRQRARGEMILEHFFPSLSSTYFGNLVDTRILAQKYERLFSPEQVEENRNALRKIHAELVNQSSGQRLINHRVHPIDVINQIQPDPFEDNLRRFCDRKLAAGYVRHLAESQPLPTENDVATRYKERFYRYHTPAGIKWQRIDVNYDQHPTRDAALAAAEAIRQEIHNGLNFSIAASQRSDSELAAVSGLTHWVSPSDVVNAKLLDTLKTLPEGDVSPVIALDQCFSIIRVIGRRGESTISGESVFNTLYLEISNERIGAAAHQFIKQSRAKADIYSILDPDWDEYWAMNQRP